MAKGAPRSFVDSRADLIVVAKSILHSQVDLKDVGAGDLNRVFRLDPQKPKLVDLSHRRMSETYRYEDQEKANDPYVPCQQFPHAQSLRFFVLPR